MKKLFKYLLVFAGLFIIGCSIYFFTIIRGFPFSIASLIIIIICLTLIFMTFFQNRIIILFFGMKISDMNLHTTTHYHSMISNLIIAFSSVIGIGISLVWSSQGDIWKTNNFWLFAILLIYFIFVIYFVLLKEFQEQIVELNKNKKENTTS
jgi:hypothetical protein